MAKFNQNRRKAYSKSGAPDQRTTEGKAMIGQERLEIFRSLMDDIEAGTITAEQAMKKLDKGVQSVVSSTQQLNKLVQENEKASKGLVGSLKGAFGFLLDETKLKIAQEDLNQAIRDNDKDKAKAAAEQVQSLQKQNKAAQEAYNDFKAFFPGFIEFLENVDKVRNVFGQISKRLGRGGPIVAGLLIGLAVLVNFVKQANALSQEFGGGLKANLKIAGALKTNTIRAKLFALSAEQVRSSFDAIANTFDDVSVDSAKFAVDLAKVSRDTGVSAENVANLISLFNPLTNGSRQLSLDLVESVSSLARAQGVASGVLIDELASNADLFASFIGKGEQNLIKAAAAAKKVGVEFGSIVELGDGLLDITERINKEQTLSTILGKQISLERFTALNAAGDTVAAQQELARLLKNTADLSPQLRRLFAAELNLGVADIQRLTGLRSGMPMAGGGGTAGMSAYEKETISIYKKIEKNTKQTAENL